jgi:hypothetical protein
VNAFFFLFNLRNHSGRTRPDVYSYSNRNVVPEAEKVMFLGSIARPVRTTDNLTTIREPIVWTTWDPQHLTTL